MMPVTIDMTIIAIPLSISFSAAFLAIKAAVLAFHHALCRCQRQCVLPQLGHTISDGSAYCRLFMAFFTLA